MGGFGAGPGAVSNGTIIDWSLKWPVGLMVIKSLRQ